MYVADDEDDGNDEGEGEGDSDGDHDHDHDHDHGDSDGDRNGNVASVSDAATAGSLMPTLNETAAVYTSAPEHMTTPTSPDQLPPLEESALDSEASGTASKKAGVPRRKLRLKRGATVDSNTKLSDKVMEDNKFTQGTTMQPSFAWVTIPGKDEEELSFYGNPNIRPRYRLKIPSYRDRFTDNSFMTSGFATGINLTSPVLSDYEPTIAYKAWASWMQKIQERADAMRAHEDQGNVPVAAGSANGADLANITNHTAATADDASTYAGVGTADAPDVAALPKLAAAQVSSALLSGDSSDDNDDASDMEEGAHAAMQSQDSPDGDVEVGRKRDLSPTSSAQRYDKDFIDFELRRKSLPWSRPEIYAKASSSPVKSLASSSPSRSRNSHSGSRPGSRSRSRSSAASLGFDDDADPDDMLGGSLSAEFANVSILETDMDAFNNEFYLHEDALSLELKGFYWHLHAICTGVSAMC